MFEKFRTAPAILITNYSFQLSSPESRVTAPQWVTRTASKLTSSHSILTTSLMIFYTSPSHTHTPTLIYYGQSSRDLGLIVTFLLIVSRTDWNCHHISFEISRLWRGVFSSFLCIRPQEKNYLKYVFRVHVGSATNN